MIKRIVLCLSFLLCSVYFLAIPKNYCLASDELPFVLSSIDDSDLNVINDIDANDIRGEASTD